MRSNWNKIHRAAGRLTRGEEGQAILFGAVSLLLIATFVALAFNVGRAVQRRIQTQMAADAAAYSGAAVKANAVSSIAWLNDAMAQVYYNLLRYSVDASSSAVLAELARQEYLADLDRGVSAGPGMQHYTAAWQYYNRAFTEAQTGVAVGAQWLENLSRLENAIAIATPRLMQEEMYRAAEAAGAERIAVYPSHRLFPAPNSERRYKIEQFSNGWRITNLLGGENIGVWLESPTLWRIVYGRGDTTTNSITVEEAIPDNKWVISEFDGAGALIRVYTIIRTSDLGWVLADYQPQTPSAPTDIQVDQVDMDGDGTLEGTRITFQGDARVYRIVDGAIEEWRFGRGYVPLDGGGSSVNIGGANVSVNTRNTALQIPGLGSVNVGRPTIVQLTNARLVLSNPPHITTGFGDVNVHVSGFEISQCSISVAGYGMSLNNADGVWRKRYRPDLELWERHRLTPQTPTPPASGEWLYEYELMGAHMKRETNFSRFAQTHALGDRGEAAEWTAWYSWQMHAPAGWDAYHLTQVCFRCAGSGQVSSGGATTVCPFCHGRKYTGPFTEIRVNLNEVVDFSATGATAASAFGDPVRIPKSMVQLDILNRDDLYPLILSDEFFKYGVNVAAWKPPVSAPMIFDREPDWGYVAIASARIGVSAALDGGFIYSFADDGADARANWIENNAANLYSPAVSPRLWSSRRNVADFDIEPLPDAAVVPENGIVYLWDALLGANFEQYTWDEFINAYQTQNDAQVASGLRAMRRDFNGGTNFNPRDPALEDLIWH